VRLAMAMMDDERYCTIIKDALHEPMMASA
jgi:hypothetical protein